MPRYLDPLGDDLALDLTESAALAQLVEAPIIPAAGGGVTGTIARTNANDSVSASGDAGEPPQPTGGGAARPRMRYERQPLPTIEDELEEIALALLMLL